MNHHKLDNALARAHGVDDVGEIRVQWRSSSERYLRAVDEAAMGVSRLGSRMGLLPPRFSIGVDVDDVLYGWYARAHEICTEAGITNGVQPTTWAPHEEYGCEHQAWIDALDEATVSGRLYDDEPFEDVVEQLWRLRAEGHYVHLVTARGAWAHSDLVKQHTRDWIERHEIPHDSLTFTKHKPDVPCDFFIDDHVRNYRELDAAGVEVFLVNRPWNAEEPAARRVDSITEFVDIILEAS